MNMNIESAYKIIVEKFSVHMKKYGDNAYEFAGACKTGDYYSECGKNPLSDMYNWTTSFITGMAPLLYKTEKDEGLLKWADKFRAQYHDKIFKTPLDTMHDIGFLYMPYSAQLYRITGMHEYREDALKAADELAKRFDLRGYYIDAWNRMNDDVSDGRAIIDSMMNIPLLMWAWKETGHIFYKNTAVFHADTISKYFIREDRTVAHSYNFDRKSGEILCENNGCGYQNGSWWARGTAWAIYGFAILARHTGDKKYLKTAEQIADRYLEQMGDELIPVWDFRLPEEAPAKMCDFSGNRAPWDETNPENIRYAVDTSAAAIAGCGCFELYKMNGNSCLEAYARKTANELCSYINNDTNIAGVLGYQNGQCAYTVYGDFFAAELLQRILFDTETCW